MDLAWVLDLHNHSVALSHIAGCFFFFFFFFPPPWILCTLDCSIIRPEHCDRQIYIWIPTVSISVTGPGQDMLRSSLSEHHTLCRWNWNISVRAYKNRETKKIARRSSVSKRCDSEQQRCILNPIWIHHLSWSEEAKDTMSVQYLTAVMLRATYAITCTAATLL